MRKLLLVVPIVMLGAGSTACATKKFVRGEVGQVNTKVDGLSTQLEETQERTRKNEGRIVEVDQKADAAGKSASAAQATATAAQNSAEAAKGEATKAGERAAAVETASRRLVYEVVLSEDQGNFQFGKVDLPDSAKQRIDQMITELKADPKGVFIELEGHTDNVGSKEYNTKLGQDRADAVKRYLYEAHQVPLHKINVISYGEEKPVAPNTTKDGRAQNRRVVIKVLA
jgi:peptidoglycan-associated lipoprotein